MRHKRRYLAQKDGGGLGGLPRLEIEQGGRAGAVASKASDEGGAVPVDESSCEAGGGVREVGIAPATLNFTGRALTGG